MAEDGGGLCWPPRGMGPGGKVRRRKLFYVAGFDPASPKKYHRLYEEHAALQGALTGVRYEVGELAELEPLVSGWTVVARDADGSSVETDYRVLHWFDLVREVWRKDDVGLFTGACRALADYVRSGLIAEAAREAPPVVLTAVLPVVVGGAFLLLYALATLALAASGGVLAARLGAPWILGVLPPLLLWLVAPRVWTLVDKLLPVGWLARGMIAVTGAARGTVPAFAERSRAFARMIAAAAAEPSIDEVLIVAHSMGAQQACRALGRAVLDDPGFGLRTPVALLTLGSLLPFYSFTAKGDLAYRQEMAALVRAEHIPWIELNSPGDAGGSAAMQPLAGLGLGEPEGRPLRASPRFHTILEPSRYRALKRRPLELHFQYIRSSDTGEGYDFFRLTAGPEPLAGRAGRLRRQSEGAAA